MKSFEIFLLTIASSVRSLGFPSLSDETLSHYGFKPETLPKHTDIKPQYNHKFTGPVLINAKQHSKTKKNLAVHWQQSVTGPGGFMVVLCPGVPEGSTGSGLGLKRPRDRVTG